MTYTYCSVKISFFFENNRRNNVEKYVQYVSQNVSKYHLYKLKYCDKIDESRLNLITLLSLGAMFAQQSSKYRKICIILKTTTQSIAQE